MKTRLQPPEVNQILKSRVEMLCSGGKTIAIEFSDAQMAKEFYDWHKNFMLFLNQPIKTITLDQAK